MKIGIFLLMFATFGSGVTLGIYFEERKIEKLKRWLIDLRTHEYFMVKIDAVLREIKQLRGK